MTTGYTTLLGLALPVTGELSGQWGDTVNNYITNYLDASIAGAQTVSTDADVTLTKTTNAALDSTSSQYAVLLFSGSRTAQRTVTVPAASKIYAVINKTTGGYSVKLVGAGPTTGVVIAPGEAALVSWNGSDFVKVGGSAQFASSVSGTSIDLALGVYFYKTISANTTFTLANVPASGTVSSFYLELTNAGAYTTVFWSGVKWANDAPINLSTAGTDLLQFITRDGGTTWEASKIGTYGAFVRSTVLDKDGYIYGGGNATIAIVNDGNTCFALSSSGFALATAFSSGVTYTGGWTYTNSLQNSMGYASPNFSATNAFFTTSNGSNNVTVIGDNWGRIVSNFSTGWQVSTNLTNTTWGNNPIFCGSYGSGQTIIGGPGGRIAYSSNLIGWTYSSTLIATTFATQDVVILMSNNTTAVAIGSTAGAATTTDNGATWTYQAGLLTAWTSGTPVAGLYANGIFMVVGQSGKVATSTDGVTWTNQTGLSSTTWATSNPGSKFSLVYTGTTWIVGTTNGVTATSTDNGVTWTYSTAIQTLLGPSGSGGFIYITGFCKASASGSVMAYGSFGVFAYSADGGVTWTQYDGPGQNLSVFPVARGTNSQCAVVWNGTLFMAVGGTAAATSYDGVNWKLRINGLRNKWYATGASLVAYRAIAYGGGTHAIVSASASRLMTTTDNGATWTWQTGLYSTYTNLVSTGIAYGNSRFVIAGNVSRTPYSLDGGVTWTAAVCPFSSAALTCIAFGNGIFLVGSSNGRLATSATAATGSWTDYTSTVTATAFGTNSVQAICYGNSLYVVVGNTGVIMTSPDGTTWTYRGGLVTALSGTIWAGTVPSSVTWTGSEFLVVGNYNMVASSPDGINWTNLSTLVQSTYGPSPYATATSGSGVSSFTGVASNGTTAVLMGLDGYMVIR